MLKYSVAIVALLLSAPIAFAQGAGDTRKGGGAGMSSSGPRAAGSGPSSKSGSASHARSGASSGASEGASGSDSPRSRRSMERTDREVQGARSERSPRNVDRDRQFDRGGGRAEARDWQRPGYRERIRRGHHYGWGPGIGFYFSDGWYYGECGWLKRRALATDSPVWWHRYRRCREFG